jgi:hypothetical protein
VPHIHDHRRAWAATAYLVIALVWVGLAVTDPTWWRILVAIAWLGLAAFNARTATDPSAPPSKPSFSKDDADYR